MALLLATAGSATWTTLAQAQTAQPDSASRWLPSYEWTPWVLLTLAALALAMLWRSSRARKRRSQAEADPENWESRARQAEERAVAAEATVKAGLLPYLARFLRSRLLVGLWEQRTELTRTQAHGAERVEQLGERLATAQAQLQQKLTAAPAKTPDPTSSNPTPAPPAAPPSAPEHSTASIPAETPPTPTAPLRKSPLLARPSSPGVEPVEFSRIMARRKQTTEPSEPHPPSPEP
jgi:hypothetical protein